MPRDLSGKPDGSRREAASLLATKLRAPATRPVRVSRLRLLARLDAGVSRSLTLISAPAGFGKTTLVTQWMSEYHPTVAWVSLDEDDNDPASFWGHVAAALRGISPGLPVDGGASGNAQTGPAPEAVTAALINAVEEYAGEVILALDDYHLIQASTVHKGVAYLLEHLPRRLHLLLLTRSDPPLPLPRLRARDSLTEIRAADLQFTADEADAFLNEVMHLGLPAEAVRELTARTEGWVAGLQLAALSIRDRADVSGFIARFSGTHQFVLDYLMEEVLQQQSEEVRRFLVQTSILHHLTGPLCDAVTGETGGQELLRRLEQANLFLVPLDDEHRWYRYHRLFADVLRTRLEQNQSDQLSALHRRAADWYAGYGLEANAIRHALAAREFGYAADLIQEVGGQRLLSGEVETVLGWTAPLPAEMRRSRPMVLGYHAWATLLTGHPRLVEPLLREIEANLDGVPEQRKLLLASNVTLRAYVAAVLGDAGQASGLAREALTRLQGSGRSDLPGVAAWFAVLRGIATYLLGRARVLQGELTGAVAALGEAVGLAQEAGHFGLALAAVGDMAAVLVAQGRLSAATAALERAVGEMSALGMNALPGLGAAEVWLAEICRERGDLATAERYLESGMKKVLLGGVATDLVNAYLALAHLRQDRGDLDGATAAVAEAEQWLEGRELNPVVRSRVAAVRATLWLHSGRRGPHGYPGHPGETSDLEAAERWAASRPEAAPSAADFPARIAHARVQLALGRPARAASALAALAAEAGAAGRLGDLVEVSVLQAMACQAQGRLAEALAALERALALAAPEGYVRLFLAEGGPMAVLLQILLQKVGAGHGPTGGTGPAEYIGRLLSLFGETAAAGLCAEEPGERSSSDTLPLLTDRELEVLRLMAAGLTNDEIARRLFISLPTVKRHISNLFGKLEVTRRTQAVARGRELALL